MYSGRQPAITPFTAIAQIVTARLSGSTMPSDLFRIAVGEAQELLDLLDRRRNDRQAVAPLALVEILVDLLERAAEHDVRADGSGSQLGLVGLRQQIVDHLLRR